MKKILITGVCGMIGSHLLDELLKNPNNEIVGIDNLSFGSKDNIQHNLNNHNFNFYEIDIFFQNSTLCPAPECGYFNLYL